jgi:hypothetical protein
LSNSAAEAAALHALRLCSPSGIKIMTDSIATVSARLGLTVSAVFVPYSKSRAFKAGARASDRSLNWTVTVEHNGRAIYSTDYGAGIAHAPSYRNKVHGAPHVMTINRDAALVAETETGRSHVSPFIAQQTALLPDTADVLACLAMECDALDHSTFEDWAESYGYDSDSRKAEATYRACLATALALRSALGDAALAELREAAAEH